MLLFRFLNKIVRTQGHEIVANDWIFIDSLNLQLQLSFFCSHAIFRVFLDGYLLSGYTLRFLKDFDFNLEVFWFS